MVPIPKSTNMSSDSVIVVDASVVVKWFIPEQDHQNARALRADYLDGAFDLLAPSCLSFEVLNALRYSDFFSADDLTAAAETVPKYGIRTIPFGGIERIVPCAETLDIPIYDAAYLAVAAEHETTMQTADEQLIETTHGTEYAAHIGHINEYTERS